MNEFPNGGSTLIEYRSEPQIFRLKSALAAYLKAVLVMAADLILANSACLKMVFRGAKRPFFGFDLKGCHEVLGGRAIDRNSPRPADQLTDRR
jgi:hypothetical protein